MKVIMKEIEGWQIVVRYNDSYNCKHKFKKHKDPYCKGPHKRCRKCKMILCFNYDCKGDKNKK